MPHARLAIRLSVFLGLFAAIASACDGAAPLEAPDAPDGGRDAESPPERVACDALRPPVVMAHGFLAAGDTWAALAQRLASNGDCPNRLFAFDWNPFERDAAITALDAFVTRVLAETGATTVQLVGHSAGGSLGYAFLADPTRAARVSHYVHVGSSPTPVEGAPPGPAGPPASLVPTLNLWSTGDTVVPGADIPGATNVRLEGLDHYEVATSAASFAAIHAHLRGASPATDARDAAPFTVPGPRSVSGKALALGDNAPAASWEVAVWEVSAEAGTRLGSRPVANATVADDGAFGPFLLRSGVPHEFHLTGPTASDRAIHYYREPFMADDHHVYLRVLPRPDTLVGLLFNSVTFSERSPLVIAFASSRAVLAGRDSLVVDGEELATEAFAAPERTAIAWFLYDDGDDGRPGGAIDAFSSMPAFLAAVDRVYPTSAGPSLALSLNGRTLRVPRWAAATDGATVVIFD